MSTGTNVTNPAPRSLRHAQEVIREAQHELNQLLRQRVTIMRRIGTVKQRLICLAVAFGDEVLTAEVLQVLGRGNTRKQPGFTRACRLILMEAGIPLEARQGMRELDRRFPKLVEHLKDPLASVTPVFNRRSPAARCVLSPTVRDAGCGSGSPTPATARKSLILGRRPTGDSVHQAVETPVASASWKLAMFKHQLPRENRYSVARRTAGFSPRLWFTFDQET
jgi:hypothetical protein